MKYVTDSYREGNLRKLADYLLKLPEDYKEFGMGSYFKNENYEKDEPTTVCELLDQYRCGSVGCAIGHGPLAGIGIEVFDKYYGRFDIYCSEVFIDAKLDHRAWDWCFSDDWDYVDNTHQGAAKRILWLLDKGLPDNWEDQMYGTDELCYV